MTTSFTSTLAVDTGISSTDGITGNPTLTGTSEAGGVITISNGGTVLGTVAIANAITNPNFSPDNTANNGYGAVPYWTSSTTTRTGSNVYGQPFWDNGTLPGGITTVGFVQLTGNYLSETVSLVVGQTYTLSYLENARISYSGTPTTEALVNGVVVVAAHSDTAVGGTNAFRSESATFVATATTETIEFLTTAVTGGTAYGVPGGDATALYADVAVTPDWSFTPTLADGTYTLTASETNTAGSVVGSSSLGLTLETTAPVVNAVTASPATSDVGIAGLVTLALGFNKSVFVTGTPTLTLNDGGTASYVSGSGTASLVFSYMVAAGQTTADLTVTGSALNGGTITDAAGNAADLAGAVANPSGTLQIDTTPPVVTEALAVDTGVSNTDRITSNPTLTGTAEAGVVTISNGATVLGTATLSNAITNPNFGPDNTANYGYGAVPAWTSNAAQTGSNVYGQPFWDNGTVPTGITTVGFAQGLGVYLSQTVSLVVGTTYTLSYLENARIASSGVPITEALVNGHIVVAAHNDTAVGGTSAFRSESGTFVATATSETVEFLTTAMKVSGADGTALYANVSVVATAGASWSFTPTLADGTYTLTASETDAAGNVGSTSLGLTLETTAPVVNAVTTSPTTSDVGVGGLVTLALGFNKPVFVSGAPTLTLNDGGTATYVSGSGTASLAFSYTVAAGQTTSDLTVTAAALNGGTITDAAGNAANLGGAVTNPTGTLQIDGIAPVVSTVTAAPATSDLGIGGTVTLTLGLSKVVTVSGTPTLTLNDGGTATYVSGSGTASLVFRYTVAAGQTTSDLTVTTAALNGGAVTDAVGNAANLAGAATNPTGTLQIDGIAPVVSTVTASPATSDLGIGGVVTLTLGLSKPVTVRGTPTLVLNDGGAATYVSGSGTASLVFRYTVAAGQTASDLTVTGSALNGGTITDAAGNAANLGGAVTNPTGTLQIDGIAPVVSTVTASPSTAALTYGQTDALTLTLSKPVTVDGGVPTLSLNDGGTATYVSGSGSAALVFSYTVGAGQTTPDLAVTGSAPNGASITDAAGNAANLTGAVATPAGTLAVDSSPKVTGITVAPTTGPLGPGKMVTFTVALNQAVTVLGGIPDLTLSDGGTALYTGGTGTASLTFAYTVAAGDNASDLLVTGIALNSATIGGPGSLSLAASTSYAAGPNPYSVTTADLTGNGIQDAVFADVNLPATGESGVSVLLGNGSGGFAVATTYAAGPGCRYVTTADLTGNGIQDLVAADVYGGVAVLMGNGSGGFAAATFYAAGPNPVSLTTADLTGNHIQDIVVADIEGGVAVIPGNGSGGFAAPTTYAAGSEPDAVTTADLTGNGIQDIVVADFEGGVAVLMGDGRGGFAAATTYAVGEALNSVTTADLTGNGIQDIVVADVDGGVAVLMGNGRGGFAAATTYAAGPNPLSVTTADLTGNGIQDLVVADEGGGVAVLPGNGSGGFAAATTYAAGLEPHYVTTADLTGDGRPDILVADAYGGLSVLLNNSIAIGTFDPATASGANTGLVIDTTPPVLSTPAAITIDATSAAGAVVTFTGSAVDAVNGAEPVTFSKASGSTFALGTTTVTETATDASGNTATSTFTVKVQDTTPPVLTTPTAITVEATSAAGAVVTFAGSALDVVNGAEPVTFSKASGSTFALGTTTVTETATDASGNTATSTFTVKVQDTTPPVLTTPTAIIVEATSAAGAVVTFAGSALDVVNGAEPVTFSKASGSTFALGTTTVTETATDASGNTATSTFTVKVQDTTPPVLTTPTAITVEATSAAGAVVTFAGSALDVVNGAEPVTFSEASGSTFALGTTTVTETATDASGNTATSTFTVKVQDTTPPVVSTVTASPAMSDLGPGGVVTLTLGFSKVVTVTGVPTLMLNDGGIATYSGGSGTSGLTFSYTVASGQNTPSLAITGGVLNGAAITDFDGVIANLSGANTIPAGSTQIDTTAPVVTVSLATATAVTTLTGTGDPNATVTLTIGGTTQGTATANGSGIWTFAPTLAAGLNTVVASETDAAGNTGMVSLAVTLATTAASTNIGAVTGSAGVAGSNVTVYEPSTGSHTIILGAGANNTAVLGGGNDTISATGSGDTITGGSGIISISTLLGNSTVSIGNGNDTVTLNSSGANNTITVGNGNDHITAGNAGNETVTAGSGNNIITAGGANDVITAGAGANTITAAGASATVTTGNGSNLITAGGANDQITTGSGNDTITVTAAGLATIRAGLGLNTIAFAGSGNIIINQGGTDTLTDTGTNNTIVLPLAGQGLDTINGNILSNGDIIDLRAAMAATGWDQQMIDLGSYLSLGASGSNTIVMIDPTGLVGGMIYTVAILNNTLSVSPGTFLAHALVH